MQTLDEIYRAASAAVDEYWERTCGCTTADYESGTLAALQMAREYARIDLQHAKRVAEESGKLVRLRRVP